MTKILFPTDYSDSSAAALPFAVSLARSQGGRLVVLHVKAPASPYLESGASPEVDVAQAEFHRLLEASVNGEACLTVDRRVVTGDPATAIIDVAATDQVDGIVMGTTGRTGLRRLLLGSVAEEVVRRASCPVVTIRAERAHREVAQAQVAAIRSWPVNEMPAFALPVDESPAETSVAPGVDEAIDHPALALLTRAITARASDLHIDPIGDELRVRFRVDGRMRQYCRLSADVGRGITTQFKLLADLDIADPFHVQEGRLRLPPALKRFEVRITVAPAASGESLSLRILGRDRLIRRFEELGFGPTAEESLERIMRHGEGLVLVTGPTGSGKTTTMYSMLHSLDDGTRNIVSIEDPVEFLIPRFRQLGVNPRHDLTMTTGLRAILRLDPDIVLVGEIRDPEAAETAMRAASSGKYVFTSFHTRDVASTVTALRDLKIDNRSLAGNLSGIVSQRLMRRLCRECCQSRAITEDEASLFLANGVAPPRELSHPVGCSHCHETGYYDRIGVFEVVTPTREITEAIADGANEDDLRTMIRQAGSRSIEADALDKVAMGLASIEEFADLTTIKLDS